MIVWGTHKVKRQKNEEQLLSSKEKIYKQTYINVYKVHTGKRFSRKANWYLHPIPPMKRPFDIIHIYHLRPFVQTWQGYKYVLVMIDNLTMFNSAVRNTETTIRKLESFIDRFGAPGKIIRNRGTSFSQVNLK